ncbi:MAG: enoyl-CoA hydratase/isomerase family protein [Deltaproteobacteria bacterium]|nr:enoyl-CoA hydratase/isomerase family protein [Deltaproteobacteria bacterium]
MRPYKHTAVPLSSNLTYQQRGKVAWIQLCRPASGNRLTPDMAAELTAFCQTAEDDDTVELVVLTGNGTSFCLGLEYTTDKTGTATAQDIQAQFGELRCVEALAAITKPTLAALNGDALGVGLELALACDLRVAIESARFALPHIAQGLIPFGGGTQRLPRLVGQAKALELILLGESIDAQEAQRIGLVTTAVPASTFTTRVDEVVQNLLEKGPIALRLGKEAVHKAMDLTLDQGLRLEEDLYALLQTTQDRAEGVRAFLGKKKPTFVGQ